MTIERAQYFRLKEVKNTYWLVQELENGNILYDHHNHFNGISGREYITFSRGRRNYTLYPDTYIREILRMINTFGNVYWRNSDEIRK